MQELIFQLADVFVVVVNHFTVLDEDYLKALCDKLHQKERLKEVYVVHNFREEKSENICHKLWQVNQAVVEQISNKFLKSFWMEKEKKSCNSMDMKRNE